MDDASKIDRQKVTETFDKRAREFQNEDAVLDANVSEARKNILRNYLHKKLVLKYIKPKTEDVIVDYGCGVGRLSRLLSKHVHQVDAFDKSNEMIRVAEAMTDARACSNVNYRVLNTDKLPLQNESVTKFFSFWVL